MSAKPIRLTRLAGTGLVLTIALAACGGIGERQPIKASPEPSVQARPTAIPTPKPLPPLSVEYMRHQEYPGSEITIEETLAPGANYSQYLTSYRSEGLKIFALLTVPLGTKPSSGWPAIIFDHGYIPPAEYRTTERYVAYVDGFARNGFVIFKPDYRGHGSSEGQAPGGYGSPAYTIDVLNALSSLKRYKDIDPDRIGMWGHSMGGHLTLRSMVTVKDIKAGVIWGGVVASYPDLMSKWRRTAPGGSVPTAASAWRQSFISQYGSPEENPEFWNSISPNSYLGLISGPVQLHHGTADQSVPITFSETLTAELQGVGKPVEFFSYPGDDHNLSGYFGLAMQRSIAFFNRYVKG